MYYLLGYRLTSQCILKNDELKGLENTNEELDKAVRKRLSKMLEWKKREKVL